MLLRAMHCIALLAACASAAIDTSHFTLTHALYYELARKISVARLTDVDACMPFSSPSNMHSPAPTPARTPFAEAVTAEAVTAPGRVPEDMPGGRSGRLSSQGEQAPA